MTDCKMCKYCFNARICPPSDDIFETELTDENDFSSCTVGNCAEGYSIMINSGGGKPVEIEFRKWFEESKEWHAVGYYVPKFCPECGRKINEYKEREEHA